MGDLFAGRGVLVLAALLAGCGGGAGGAGGHGGDGQGGSGPASGAAGTGTTGAAGAGGAIGAGGASGTSGTAGTMGAMTLYGQPYAGGQFHLGPVDYTESQWHNACAPGTKYAPAIQQLEGTLLAGLWNGIPNVAGYCDACIWVTTAMGKSALLRVVTYGDTTTNSIDVSPEAYGILNSGEYPRAMTWQFAECPDTGPVVYEFQTAASEYWTSLWIRNARVPLSKVEVRSANHASFVALSRGSDGTLTDAAGFGNGSFTIRSTGINGTQIMDTFAWPSAGVGGQTLMGSANFP